MATKNSITFKKLVSLPIAEGATSPDPGRYGVSVYSLTLKHIVTWVSPGYWTAIDPGALRRDQNLADLTNVGAAQTALGLGGLATADLADLGLDQKIDRSAFSPLALDLVSRTSQADMRTVLGVPSISSIPLTYNAQLNNGAIAQQSLVGFSFPAIATVAVAAGDTIRVSTYSSGTVNPAFLLKTQDFTSDSFMPIYRSAAGLAPALFTAQRVAGAGTTSRVALMAIGAGGDLQLNIPRVAEKVVGASAETIIFSDFKLTAPVRLQIEVPAETVVGVEQTFNEGTSWDTANKRYASTSLDPQVFSWTLQRRADEASEPNGIRITRESGSAVNIRAYVK